MSAVDPAPSGLDAAVARAFAPAPSPLAETQALVVEHHGEIVVERYADGFDHKSTFISWSMAKSMISAVCGILIGEGRLDLDAPAPVPEWRNDPRQSITLRHLLTMRSGLQWNEDYVDDTKSDVIEMLFGSGKADTAAFAIAKPLEHEPDTHWLYSSGTSNIIARIVGDIVAAEAGATTPADRETAMRRFLTERLFEPVAMASAKPRFDAAGTFIASSFVFATARDFAAFGRLFANSGRVGAEQIIDADWVTESTRVQAVCPETDQGYGMQWWSPPGRPDRFSANGYEGQMILVAPDVDAVVVRLGKTPDVNTNHAQLRALCAELLECL